MTNRNKIGNIGFLAPVGQSARDLEKEHFISAALHLPDEVIGYHVSERLSALFPDKALVETIDGDFGLEEYARAGHCTLAAATTPYGQWMTAWLRLEGIRHYPHNVWLDITWQGHDLDVLVMYWEHQPHYFILAATREVAADFFAAVCRWNTEIHDEILIFEGGHWAKDEHLFAAIKGARLDNLVLRLGLKEEILDDVTRFFAAQATYASFGVPWKRGILFAGPPGNGKTHAVKALVNTLGQPCLYVKSFKQGHSPDEYGMRTAFAQARASAPCVLVLEDLDALVTDQNRSFFLNEMDGFAANGGILTLATTNYPERLDPAIVHRPSRFDRTYRFDLPAVAERATYIARWNASLRPEMRLPEQAIGGVAERTAGFSFAYLKELFLSAVMRWMEVSADGAMEVVMAEQVDLLRGQMLSAAPSAAAASGHDGDGDEDDE